MRLAIRHETSYRYAPAAAGLGLMLRLFPASAPGQQVVSWSVTAAGRTIEPLLVNGFGDKEGLWLSHRPLEEVAVVAEGVVETEDVAGVIGRYGRARPWLFLRETPLTAPDDAVRAFAEGVGGASPLERMHALCEAVADAIAYRPGATHALVTAAEALALGAGVCQDQTHLLIAAARHLGHPARYVVGYLHDEAESHAETHAWAEAHLEGLGWVGFDPTHRQSPTPDYVRLASGLDSRDAAPIRGTYVGTPEESLAATVSVAAAGQSQSQSQQ